MTVEALRRLLTEHRAPPAPIDTSRMQRERRSRLQDEMARQGVEVALLLHGPNVAYATGLAARGVDVTHAVFERPVAIVVAGEDRTRLLWDDIDAALDVEGHPAVWPELDEGADQLARALADVTEPLAGRRVAVDEQTGAMRRAGVLDGATVLDASHLVAAAKLVKTTDELACIAEAQRRNEQAMLEVQQLVRPGLTRSQVAGAFLAQLCDGGDAVVAADAAGDGPAARSSATIPTSGTSGAGVGAAGVGVGGLGAAGVGAAGVGVAGVAGANLIDPIFQPMPRAVANGPRTTTGGVAFPTGVGDPTFGEGDLVWVDTGIDHCGYASDFGRTWVVGREPNLAEQRLFERWCEVMVSVLEVLRPGVTGGDLCRAAEAANGGDRPWLPHFYLAHGVGVESAEMPLIGTDLGSEFDDALVMAPGMVLVLEPVIWEDGVGGYRAEEIVAMTQDGWCHLGSGHPYAPFDR